MVASFPPVRADLLPMGDRETWSAALSPCRERPLLSSGHGARSVLSLLGNVKSLSPNCVLAIAVFSSDDSA
jgi:hypothetical protein